MRLTLRLVAVALLLAACSTQEPVAQQSLRDQIFPPGELRGVNYSIVENATAECMAEAGFEYSQSEPDPLIVADLLPATLAGLDLQEPEVTGLRIATSYVPPARDRDANTARLRDMSESAATQWFDASRECRRTAQQEVNAAWFEGIAPVRNSYSAMEERVSADQRTVDLEETWSACMSESGHPFGSVSATFETLSFEFVQFQSRVGERLARSGDPDFALLPQEEEELASLVNNERVVAAAAAACAAPLIDRYSAVRDEYEAEFLDTLEQPIPAIPGADA